MNEPNTLDELKKRIVQILDFNTDENTGGFSERLRNYYTESLVALFTEHSKEVDRLARIDERENMKFIDNDGKETHLPYVQYRYTGDGLLVDWEDRTAQLKRNKGEDNEL